MNSTSNPVPIKQRTVCSSSRVLETLLMLCTSWAGIVMFMTPFLLKQDPPKPYKVLLEHVPNWEVGLAILILALMQAVALSLSPGCPGERDYDPGGITGSSYNLATLARLGIVMCELAIWTFLATVYIVLWYDRGQVTLASGLCVIIAGMCSATSFCLSRDRSRQRTREEILTS